MVVKQGALTRVVNPESLTRSREPGAVNPEPLTRSR